MPLLETRQERAALLILILAVTVAIGLGPFVSGLLGAAVLYVVLVRPCARLERVSKPGIAAAVVLITALLLIALPAAWLVSSLIDQAPDALQRIQASDPVARLGRVRIGNSPSSVLSHHPPMPNAIIRFRQARTPRSIVLAATTVVLTRGATAQSGQHPVDEFLARTVVLTPAETTSLARGDAVARILRTGENQDVAVFGAVRINVSRSFFMDGQRDLPRALRSPMRTQVHLFSEPATVADVQALTMSDDDVKELRTCKPNECNFKLPATDMERLKRTIDLSAPDATANAATYARQRMVDYTTDYRARGNAAMLVYEDRGVVRGSDAFAAMLRDSSYLFSAVPSLGDYFLNYPRHAPAGSTDAIFWSRDEMQNLRPVLRITHQVIYSPSDVPELSLVAAKQIYANHYFEAGLEVLAAADRTASAATGGEPGITVIAVRRYRFDHLPSGGVVNLRSRVTNGLRDNVRADLARLKRESEAARGAHDR